MIVESILNVVIKDRRTFYESFLVVIVTLWASWKQYDPWNSYFHKNLMILLNLKKTWFCSKSKI